MKASTFKIFFFLFSFLKKQQKYQFQSKSSVISRNRRKFCRLLCHIYHVKVLRASFAWFNTYTLPFVIVYWRLPETKPKVSMTVDRRKTVLLCPFVAHYNIPKPICVGVQLICWIVPSFTEYGLKSHLYEWNPRSDLAIMYQHSEFGCERSSGSEDVVRTKEQNNDKRTHGQTNELNPMSLPQLH